MNIYQETIPYFYIIRNKETKIMYAGSKWAEGCNPDTFMIQDGYQTSSPTIQNIITKFGLDIFEILRIDTYCDGLHVHEYESLFLKVNKCAGSLEWYNNHNNDGKMAFGTQYFTLRSLELFGVEHPAKAKQTQDKQKSTNIEKYGTENVFQNERIKEKSKKTRIEKYGNENYNNLEKNKETCLILYGVDNPGKRIILCEFCNEYKNINHRHQCKLNPNRNVWDRSGKNHPNAKTYYIQNPERKIIPVTGNIEKFCKSNGFTWGRLKRGTVPNWQLL